MHHLPDCWVVIPAAGVGSRMQSEVPKQYLLLAGKPVLRHTVDALIAHPSIKRVLLVLAPHDPYFDGYDWSEYGERLIVSRVGGESRAASVHNGLEQLQGLAGVDDWVLVHDAARPCLARAELQRLINSVAGKDAVGGILAVPVADTLKRADDTGHIDATVSRENLWQAQTPQMFRYGLLLRALQQGANQEITDEASAIERFGLHPRLVMGSTRNIKITFPGDLPFAEWILQQKESQ